MSLGLSGEQVWRISSLHLCLYRVFRKRLLVNRDLKIHKSSPFDFIGIVQKAFLFKAIMMWDNYLFGCLWKEASWMKSGLLASFSVATFYFHPPPAPRAAPKTRPRGPPVFQPRISAPADSSAWKARAFYSVPTSDVHPVPSHILLEAFLRLLSPLGGLPGPSVSTVCFLSLPLLLLIWALTCIEPFCVSGWVWSALGIWAQLILPTALIFNPHFREEETEAWRA